MGKTKIQHVPNRSSLYPISFALSSTLENVNIQPKGGYYNTSILGLSKAWFFYLFICDGPIKDSHHPKKKKKSYSHKTYI
jgi:hypothetical protein